MKKKLLAAVLLVTILLCPTCGCKKQKVYGEEIPVYTSDKVFHIGMWVGIPDRWPLVNPTKILTDEEFEDQFRLMKEAGFSQAENGYGQNSVEQNKRALAAAEKAGIGMRVYDAEIFSLLYNSSLEEDQIELRLRQYSERYTGYKSFTGIKVADEPSYDMIKDFKKGKEIFDKVFGDEIMYHFNLNPVVAASTVVTTDYREYIREYVRQINTPYVSYDHYVLVRDIKGNPKTLSTFLYNMEAVKMAAPDKEMYTFLQSTRHGACRELESVADATFQTYSFLAFGGAGIDWFCYGLLPENDGATNFWDSLIGRDFKPTPTYDYVKTANLEIRAFEHIYHNFDWKGVMTTIGTENETGGENANFNMLSDSLISSHDRIKAIKASQDTLTGVFKDGEGRDGFMIVNFTEPGDKLKDKVEIEFNDSSRAIVVKKGVQQIVDTDGGKLSFTMNEGEGYFVIPLK